MTAKILPRDITSYDVLKAVALLIMIIDHVGAFFFPHELWFRAIGRIGFPIWVFLIGYSSSRNVPVQMWLGGALTTAAFALGGMYIFPVNVLFTLAVTRLLIDPTMKIALKNYVAFWLVLFVLVVTLPYTRVLFEYGTLALMFAMFGYMRRQTEIVRVDGWAQVLFVFIAGIVFVISQIAVLPYTLPQAGLIALGTLVFCVILFVFRPQTYPTLTALAGPLGPVIRFMGRRTLEIYVVHLVIFVALGAILKPGPDFLAFDWIAPVLLQITPGLG